MSQSPQHDRQFNMSLEDQLRGDALEFAAASSAKPWNYTFTGRIVNPLELRPDDVCIEDIAHHLATYNRWGGALVQPMSVAQHCWHVSYLLEGTGEELEGLMHDADEAYLGDMIKWLKASPIMQPFRDACDRAHKACATALGYSAIITDNIDRADKRMVAIEAGYAIWNWQGMPGYPPATESERNQARFWDGFWSWQDAEQRFLERYRQLQTRRRDECFSRR